MIMAFPTKSKAHTDLIAALHPYDLTARPQVVRKNWNPGYHKVLKTFEEITGVGGVLNTSFNLSYWNFNKLNFQQPLILQIKGWTQIGVSTIRPSSFDNKGCPKGDRA